MKFGENLYHLRKDAKMSQEKLAEKVGVSRQSVSKWENGEAYPEMEKILKICKIFHCKLNDIIHDDIQDIDSLDEDVKMSIVKFEREKQKRLKIISKIIYILAKIGDIASRVGVVGLLIGAVVINIIINSTNVKNASEIDIQLGDSIVEYKNIDGKISVSSNNAQIQIKESDKKDMGKIAEILANNSKGKILIALNISMVIFVVAMVLLSIAMNHLYKLFKNIYDGDTPFTLDNVYHIKRMTYIMIAITILTTFGNAISGIIVNQDFDLDIGFDVITILFLYSIAYIFEYGYQIQLDSKGRIYGEENE